MLERIGIAAGETQMTDSARRATDPESAHPNRLLEAAVNNLALGLMIFDDNEELVFCNKRYMEIYGLVPSRSGREPRSRS